MSMRAREAIGAVHMRVERLMVLVRPAGTIKFSQPCDPHSWAPAVPGASIGPGSANRRGGGQNQLDETRAAAPRLYFWPSSSEVG